MVDGQDLMVMLKVPLGPLQISVLDVLQVLFDSRLSEIGLAFLERDRLECINVHFAFIFGNCFGHAEDRNQFLGA